MFPPTHRIYRSIRPRNRFLIRNKRRGLQAVAAICISLILIIYGLEHIYAAHDLYDDGMQNFENEKRRLVFEDAQPGEVREDPTGLIPARATQMAVDGEGIPNFFMTDNQWWQVVESASNATPQYKKVKPEEVVLYLSIRSVGVQYEIAPKMNQSKYQGGTLVTSATDQVQPPVTATMGGPDIGKEMWKQQSP